VYFETVDIDVARTDTVILPRRRTVRADDSAGP
jgi:hypothetical protein